MKYLDMVYLNNANKKMNTCLCTNVFTDTRTWKKKISDILI